MSPRAAAHFNGIRDIADCLRSERNRDAFWTATGYRLRSNGTSPPSWKRSRGSRRT